MSADRPVYYTNTVENSTVDIMVKGVPLAFLHPYSGEVLIVPASDAAKFRGELNRVSDIVQQYHAANYAAQVCEHHWLAVSTDPKASFAQVNQAECAFDWSTEWMYETHAAFRKVFEELDPADYLGPPLGQDAPVDSYKGKSLHDGGKRLVELILVQRKVDEARTTVKAREEQTAYRDKAAQPTMSGSHLTTKQFAFSSAAELKTRFQPQLLHHQRVAYVSADKIKPAWPALRNKQATRWNQVADRGSDGKTRLDPGKLRAYVREQISAYPLTKAFFGDDLSIHGFGALAEVRHESTHAVPVAGATIDVALSAEAQLMRYAYGGSLEGDISFREGRINAKMAGHAEVDLASARADISVYLPREDGYLMQVCDLDGALHDLVAVRGKLTFTVSGMVGASIGAELGLTCENHEQGAPRAKGIPGRKGRGVRKKRTAVINRPDVMVGTADTELSLFAGVRADATISGTLQWRDPTSTSKDFVDIATVSPKAGVSAGVSAEAKFKVDLTQSGIFRVSVHASLCIGVGAQGGIAFDVDVMQMNDFMKCIYFNALYWQMKNLEIFEDKAFKALRDLTFLAVHAGQDFGAKVKFVNNLIEEQTLAVLNEFEDAVARKELAENLIRQVIEIVDQNACSTSALRYSLPETRGMLIYQLSRHSKADALVGRSVAGDHYIKHQRKAIIAILSLSVSRSEFYNVIQHIHRRGEKVPLDKAMEDLKRFLATEAVGDFNVPLYTSPYIESFRTLLDDLAMNGQFEKYVDRFEEYLVERYPHGHPLAFAMTPYYQIESERGDHRLFASTGSRAHYRNIS